MITVDDDAPADFNNIQAAIDNANNGDTVEVRAGTYTGHGNRDIDLLGKTITLKSQTRPEECIIQCGGSEYDHHRGFNIRNGEGPDTVIDGFTIQGAYVDGDWPDFCGAAIFIHLSHPTIRNCIIRQNQAVYGAGIFSYLGAPTISNSTFTDNLATSNGGAIFCIDSNADIYKVTIRNNSALLWGGGIMDDNANSIIQYSTISDNSAAWGGAVCSIEGDTQILNCDLYNNTATELGGAMFISSDRGNISEVHNSRLFENIAECGGAICCTYEATLIANSQFYDNVATDMGGAVYLDNSNATIRGSTINNNSAVNKGGGVGICEGAATIDDCDFSENTSRSGAAISSITANTTVSNSDFTDNQADLFGGAFFSWYSPGDRLSNCNMSQNEAESGGAVAAFEGILHVADCIMSDSYAQMFGGALYVKEVNYAPVTNSTFVRNQAKRGAGIYSSSSCPVISDCNISNNDATEGGGAAYFSRDCGENPTLINCIISGNTAVDAGGIGAASTALSITGCIVTMNHAQYGGGIFVGEPNTTTFTGITEIANCIISENSAAEVGGAVSIANTTAHIYDTTIMYNNARHAGALQLYDSNSPPYANFSKVVNCEIMYNAALEFGGGIYGDYASPTILNSTLALNSAQMGGAVYLYEAGGIIDGCLITQNTADELAGGILLHGGDTTVANTEVTANISAEGAGGIMCFETAATIEKCLVAGNLAVQDCAGGIAFNNTDANSPHAAVINCTIADNIADCAGGIHVGDSRPSFTNTVIFHNTSTGFCCPDIYLLNPYDYRPFSFCDLDVTLIDEYVGPGNINSDPLFQTPGYWDANGTPTYEHDDFWVAGDYHLKSEAGRYDPNSETWVIDEVTSPCIDAGFPMSPIGPEPFPNGGIVNIGAYGGTEEASKSYFGKPACETVMAGDVNGDCEIDFEDFRLMALHWREDNN